MLSRLSDSTTAFGVGFSREQLKLATENVPDAFLVQSDMTTLPFERSTFNAVVVYWSVIHVPMDDHQAVIDEFARVLRPGGRVLVCEGTNERAGENPDWLESGVKMEWNIAGAETTRDQLRGAGFDIVDEWGVPEEPDEDGADEEADDADEEVDGDANEHPGTFFSARLEAQNP